MFKFVLKTLSTKSEDEINVIKTSVSLIDVVPNNLILILFVVVLNYTWLIIPWAVIGILHFAYISFYEEKYISQSKKKVLFWNNALMWLWQWIPVLYICFSVDLGATISVLFYISCVLSSISSYFTAEISIKMFNALKEVIYVQENYYDVNITPKSMEGITQRFKKSTNQAIVYSILPKFISSIFFWWALLKAYSDFNFSIYFYLYAIFVIIFQMVMTNLLKEIKKELLNKTIKL